MSIKGNFGSYKFIALAMCMILLMNLSCNKEFKNTLNQTYNNDTLRVSDGSKRVLYIIMDGVKGHVLKSLAPENITKLTDKAIFSYDGIADVQYTALNQSSAWTTMMTGVDVTKHNVATNSFENFDNSISPSLFTRLKSEFAKSIRTVSIARSTDFIENLSKDATSKQQVTTDEEVKNSVIKELTDENPNLVVAQFNDAEIAASGDYTADNATYAASILAIDKHIGSILEALKGRKNYAKENWLVVVASSKGGGVSGGLPGSNIYDDESRNTFIAFHNSNFKSTPLNKPNVDALPYSGNAPRFQSNNSSLNGLAYQTNPNLGNFGTTGSYTIMFKLRNDGTSGQNYPMFIGKRSPTSSSAGAGGWGFLMGANMFQFDWGGSPRPNGADFRDGKWHAIGVKIFFEGTQRKLALFMNGVRMSLNNISGNLDNEYPIKIGTEPKWNTNILVKDFVMLNVGLSDEEMIKNMRKEFGTTNPYFKNALVWCPGNEESGSIMRDMSGNNNHFEYSPTVQFASFRDISPNISPDLTAAAFSSVPNGVDIPVMIYNWMNITVPQHWELMGKTLIPNVNLPK